MGFEVIYLETYFQDQEQDQETRTRARQGQEQRIFFLKGSSVVVNWKCLGHVIASHHDVSGTT